MRAAAIQVANGVTFELQSVDDQRGRRLRFGWCRWNRLFPVPGGFDVFGLGIAQDEHESCAVGRPSPKTSKPQSEEHTSELQSRLHLVCRLLLAKKKITIPEQCLWVALV